MTTRAHCARGDGHPSPALTDRQIRAATGGAAIPDFHVGDDEARALAAVAQQRGARRIAIGTGRDDTSMRAATTFAVEAQARGIAVDTAVTWPESAASWLRQARQLTEAAPDLWLLGGPARGFAQMIRRLYLMETWDPARTLTFRSLIDPVITRMCAPAPGFAARRPVLRGVGGVWPDGSEWVLIDDTAREMVAPTSRSSSAARLPVDRYRAAGSGDADHDGENHEQQGSGHAVLRRGLER